MQEIVPGIYLLKLPMDDFPPGHINAYLVEGDGKHLLIDTGWDTKNALISLKKQLAEIGASVRDISRIVLTHSHTDHAGMASRLRRLSKAAIYMHKRELDVVKSRYLSPDKSGRDRFFEITDKLLQSHGVPDPDLLRPETPLPEVSAPPLPDFTLTGGEVLSVGNFNLKVLWTPGHSPGHLSFYEPEHKVLFTGDLVLPETVSNVGLHLHQSINPLDDYLNSLEQVNSLSVRLVLPAHEDVFTDLAARVEEIMEHHKQKRAEILETIAGGKVMTAYKISFAMSMVPGTKWPSWHKLSLWDKRFILLETIAHLESLAINKKVDKFSMNGTLSYRLSDTR